MQGTQLLQVLARDRARLFTLDQAQALAAPAAAARTEVVHALHRLEREGWVVRVKPGLYALAPDLFPGPPMHEFELAMALVCPAAISHWSALQHHELTDQLPRRVYVTIPQTVTPPRLNPKLTRPWPLTFQFIRVQPERYFGFTQEWVGETRVTFTDLDRTLLDGLSRPRECGGFTEVLEAFERARGRFSASRLVEYALRLEPVVARRLGWVLEEHLGTRGAELKPLKAVTEAALAYQPLDPSAPRRGPCKPRWKLQENLPGREATQ